MTSFLCGFFEVTKRGNSILALLSLALLLAAPPTMAESNLILGVSQLPQYLNLLKQKRVGLVVNQASLSPEGHTLDYLLQSGVNIVKLFALEHGIRGSHGAGEPIDDEKDAKTGIPILSLYGENKKPTPAMLQDVDLIVFDIQDVGVRFYTYISSLGLIMEAAAESDKSLIVFDRPNPNGDYVAGPILKPQLKSFVGMYPIPIVYGLTIGELALMIQREGWVKAKHLKINVVKMKNYRRDFIYSPLAPPSPGLREIQAIRAYPSLALFEPTIISFGRGTEHPFAQYGFPKEDFGPHSFTPKRGELSADPLYVNQICHGAEFFSMAPEKVAKFTTDFFQFAQKQLPTQSIITDLKFFRLLVGDEKVAEKILSGIPYAEISEIYNNEFKQYLHKRTKYLLY